MSVEDWARREAVGKWPKGHALEMKDDKARREGAEWMAVHAFSALLSDEAVEAGATVMAESEDTGSLDSMRAALHAAMHAVTEGDTE